MLTFKRVLDLWDRPDFFFVQIGANDGLTDDPIRQHITSRSWRGILVEPLPDVFEVLKKNYEGQEGLRFVNAAVTSTDDEVVFFRHPRFTVCSGLGVRTRMQKKISMIETRVQGITMTKLFSLVPDQLDLLQIDTEGFDAEVVKAVPWELSVPRIIRYEHKHMKMGTLLQVEGGLLGRGYELLQEGNDTVAWQPK